MKTRKYTDGSAIPLVTSDSAWSVISTDAYCWYENDSSSYHNTYGVLYNWPAVNTGRLCPSGWHVPTDPDFSELVEYLGGAGQAGGLLKETGTTHWNDPNTDANDQYGFSALGGGKRFDNGSFDFAKVEGNWWSSTNYSTLTANYMYLIFNFSNSFQAYTNKKYGMSVRCVKDD